MPMSKETGKMRGAMDGSQLGDTLLCACPWVWAPVYKPGVAAQPAVSPGEVEVGRLATQGQPWLPGKSAAGMDTMRSCWRKKIKQKQSMRWNMEEREPREKGRPTQP